MNFKMPNAATVLLLALLQATTLTAKIFTRCELARELKFHHNSPATHLPTWLCIAQHESNFNTAYRSLFNPDGSREHGLFGFNDHKWLQAGSAPPGKGCNLTCEKALDDDITDDYICAQTAFLAAEKQNLSGFSPWPSYKNYCYDKVEVQRYVRGCF